MTAEQTLLQKRIQAFLENADKISAQWFIEQNYQWLSPVHRVKSMGDQWCKIVTVDRLPDGKERESSVYAFISVRETENKTLGKIPNGGIFMPANYKAPAKHARGNVFDEDFGDCQTPHGIKYLK